VGDVTDRPRLLIAGGGTGGHVFPAVAVAEALQGLADVDVVFCGTDRGIESRVVPARGWTLEKLDVVPIRGGGPVRAARGVGMAARATVHAFETVRRVRPRAALSVGGYAAGPVSLAAAALGVPIAVLEPNSTVGLANRILGRFARRAYVAWEEAASSFPRHALRPYGVPLRAGFAPTPYLPAVTPRVLVMGGSQGAAALNDRLPKALGRIGARGRSAAIVHQAGRGRDAEVREAYAREGLRHASVVPFIEDVAAAIASADVIVARAGAVTIAEITAIGRAAVLVPFPHAADDHQLKNARALARTGAAVCMAQRDADPQRIADAIEGLLADDAARRAMADASRAHGRPRAGQDVAADLLALSGVTSRRSGSG
jgi:UDP-N-acetylglucosamine--N-acetylmuramyl-(pentapeptide) pyrophosphoryl-undecaprenol N-acetylglucosamine transferase